MDLTGAMNLDQNFRVWCHRSKEGNSEGIEAFKRSDDGRGCGPHTGLVGNVGHPPNPEEHQNGTHHTHSVFLT